MERMTYKDALQNLYTNYGGQMPQYELKRLLDDGIKQGYSVRKAYNGIRLGFGLATGEHEYFSLEEVGECLGLTPDEVLKEVERLRGELSANGIDPEAVFPSVKEEEHTFMLWDRKAR